MTSRLPARGSPDVASDRMIFGRGIWRALNARSRNSHASPQTATALGPVPERQGIKRQTGVVVKRWGAPWPVASSCVAQPGRSGLAARCRELAGEMDAFPVSPCLARRRRTTIQRGMLSAWAGRKYRVSPCRAMRPSAVLPHHDLQTFPTLPVWPPRIVGENAFYVVSGDMTAFV